MSIARKHFSELASFFDEQEREQVHRLVDPVPDAHGVRAMWLQPLRAELLERLDEEKRRRFERLCERTLPMPLERHLFKFLPITMSTLCVMAGGRLLYPEQPLITASNSLVQDAMGRMVKSTMLKIMLTTCQGDLGTFMEISAQNHNVFYNHGDSFVERRAGQLCFHFEQQHTALGAYFIKGYWRAIIDVFDPTLSLRVEVLDERHFDILVTPR